MNPTPTVGVGLASVSIPSQFRQQTMVSTIKPCLRNGRVPPGNAVDVESPLVFRDHPGRDGRGLVTIKYNEWSE